MIDLEYVRAVALSFPNTTEEPHFEKTSFRVKKKIFVTYSKKEQTAVVKFSKEDQLTYTADANIYPVPNKWGEQGWTILELAHIHPDLFEAAVKSAYAVVSGTKK